MSSARSGASVADRFLASVAWTCSRGGVAAAPHRPTVIPLPSALPLGPTPPPGSASWSSPSRSSRRSTASPTRCAGCSSTSPRRATRPSWSPRPARDVRRLPGHPRPRREPAVLLRVPDRPRDPPPAARDDGAVRGPTSCTSPRPPTLGNQAARAARSLGIPTVAIYQTDLVGFAERYAVPGGARAMESLTRRIHLGVDRTLAPSTASIDQLARLGIGNVSRWPRGVDQELFRPGEAGRGAARRARARTASSSSGTSAGWRPRRSSSCSPTSTGCPGVRLVLVGGGPEEGRLRALLPDAAFLGVLHGDELARAYATLDVFVHTGRHETYCQSAQEALASGVPVVAPRVRRADRRRRRHRRRLPLRARRRRRAGRATSRGSSPSRCCGAGWRSRPGTACADGPGRRSTSCWSSHYREVSAPSYASPRRLTPHPATTATASSTLSTRCTCGSIARPRASACSSGQTGSSSVQCAPPDEHHRRDRRLVGVVVLAGVLEDLLHGAAGAGQEDDAGVADLEQHRLARRVAEVLRDRRGERVGRLVAVVPGRDAERLPAVRASASTTSNAASRPGADVGAEGRHPARPSPARRPGRPATKAPRLAASIAPGPPPVATVRCGAELVAEPRRLGVRRGAALERVPAHHADDVAVRGPRRPAPRRPGGRAAPARACRRGWPGGATRRTPARRGCRRSGACRRARAASRASCGRGRPGCRGSRGARSRPRGVRRRRPRRRTRSRGTATAPATARAAPDRAR